MNELLQDIDKAQLPGIRCWHVGFCITFVYIVTSHHDLYVQS